jgi:hypothetical protein
MSPLPNILLRAAGEKINQHLAEIAELFNPGTKLTLLARQPSHPSGDRDLVQTNDDLDAAIAALRIRRGPKSGMSVTVSERGFRVIDFTDRYGKACSAQESSIATERCLWLGVNDERMHLTQEMVANLLPALEHFAQAGTLP